MSFLRFVNMTQSRNNLTQAFARKPDKLREKCSDKKCSLIAFIFKNNRSISMCKSCNTVCCTHGINFLKVFLPQPTLMLNVETKKAIAENGALSALLSRLYLFSYKNCVQCTNNVSLLRATIEPKTLNIAL